MHWQALPSLCRNSHLEYSSARELPSPFFSVRHRKGVICGLGTDGYRWLLIFLKISNFALLRAFNEYFRLIYVQSFFPALQERQKRSILRALIFRTTFF
jgi:hypothetical protein